MVALVASGPTPKPGNVNCAYALTVCSFVLVSCSAVRLVSCEFAKIYGNGFAAAACSTARWRRDPGCLSAMQGFPRTGLQCKAIKVLSLARLVARQIALSYLIDGVMLKRREIFS